MKKKWITSIVIITLIALLGMKMDQVNASEGAGDFSVKAILPENQRNKDVTYYDLRMAPGQKQDLTLVLFNASEKEQKLSIKINPAITNDNGLIDYSTLDKKYQYDPTLKTKLSDIASTEETVTVPAKGKKETTIHLAMPDQSFDGMILGGIYITSLSDDKDDETKDSGGMQIKNKVAYTVGMVVTETDAPIKADLQYEKTFATQEAGRNIIKSKIRNTSPINVDEIDWHAKIYAKGSTEVLHQNAVSGYRMAPNSYFNYQVSWEGEPFKAGTYSIIIDGKTTTTDQKWHWEDTFEITADEAKKLNEKAIDLEEDNTWMYWALGGGIIVILLLLILIVYLWRRKKKKQALLEKQKMEKRKKARQAKRRAQNGESRPSSKKKRDIE